MQIRWHDGLTVWTVFGVFARHLRFVGSYKKETNPPIALFPPNRAASCAGLENDTKDARPFHLTSARQISLGKSEFWRISLGLCRKPSAHEIGNVLIPIAADRMLGAVENRMVSARLGAHTSPNQHGI
jgi:hypothetical protein